MIPIRFFASSLCQPLCLSCAELLRLLRVKNTERALIIVLTQTMKLSQSWMKLPLMQLKSRHSLGSKSYSVSEAITHDFALTLKIPNVRKT